MFLTESKMYSFYNINDIISESYENLLDYQDQLLALNMKMVKAEHTALVNEDAQMIVLAEEEYSSKLQATLKAIWNKIVATIEKFLIAIRKLINTIRTKYLLKKDIKEKLDRISNLSSDETIIISANFKKGKYSNDYENKETGEQISELTTGNLRITELDMDVILNTKMYDEIIKKTFGELTSGDNDAAKRALQIFDSFKENRSPDVKNKVYYKTKGFTKLLKNAYETLQIAPEWIKLLEKCRNDAKQKAKLIGSQDVKATADATYYQRTINKGIMHIQKIMTAAFKILRTIESIKIKSNDVSKDKTKENNKTTRRASSTRDENDILKEIENLKRNNEGMFTAMKYGSGKQRFAYYKEVSTKIQKLYEDLANSTSNNEKAKKYKDLSNKWYKNVEYFGTN